MNLAAPAGELFVGRDFEDGRAGCRAEQALPRHVGVVMLAGESGIGKARIAQELANVASSSGAR